jgi:predicted amidophosphoribosyltransferase
MSRHVSLRVGVPFLLMLGRTEPKRCHGPHAALRQAPFACALSDPSHSMILVLDDLATSGVTMRRSLEAIRNAGVAAFDFA